MDEGQEEDETLQQFSSKRTAQAPVVFSLARLELEYLSQLCT